MLVVSQDRKTAYVLRKYENIGVRHSSIVLYPNTVVARYESEERAQEVFENMLEDWCSKNSMAFTEQANPYWVPEK